MKKFLSLILVMAILFGIVPIVNADSSSNLTLTVDKSTVNVGDTVIVTLKTSQKVQAVDFSINYSKDIFEFVSTSIVSEDMYADKGDRVQVSAYSTSGFDTFTFTFKAKAKANTTFSTNIEALNIDQTDGNTLPFENKTVNVTVEEAPKTVEVTSISLDKTTASIKVGDTLKLTATVLPTDATNKTVIWTSSDTSVATVTNGTVKALKKGSVIITASVGDKTTTCKITVTNNTNNSNNNKDNTTSTKPIPQTGETFAMAGAVIITISIAIISIIKYKKYKDI